MKSHTAPATVKNIFIVNENIQVRRPAYYLIITSSTVGALFEENMKKTLIALTITNLLATTISFAQADESTVTKIATDETIVVTANRSTQDKFNALAAIDVFDRAAIEQIQPLSIADLLTRVAGINTSSNGSQAHQTSLFVRGTNSDHVLILVNGVRVGSATLGNKDLSAIQIQNVERVEVVKGSRAALWGSDAIGGVIQIFTRQYEAGKGQVGLKFGNDNLRQTYGVIGLGNEKHSYTLSASIESSDGFDVITPDKDNAYPVDQPDDDGYDRESISINGTSKLNKALSLEVNGLYEQGSTELDANPFYTGDVASHENHNFLARAHYQLAQSYFQFGIATSTDSNEDNFDKVSAGQAALNFQTNRDQVNALAQFQLDEQSEITIGVDWYNEEVSSSTLYSENKRDANALFFAARKELSELKLEASIRRDDVGEIEAETTYQFGAGYEILPNLMVALTQGSAFKAPSFNELYWPGDAYFVGNDNLQPETSKSTELLTRYQQGSYSIELSLYQTKFDNLIESGPANLDDPWGLWTPNNIAKATIEGIEATLSAEIFNSHNTLTLSHVDAQDDSKKEQLIRRPYFSANYSLSYYGDNWDITLDINHQGSRYDNDFNFQRIKMNSYTVFNLTAGYQVTEQLNLIAKVTNLGDKAYQQIPEYWGADRGFSVSAEYQF